jgi:hypothetical protein
MLLMILGFILSPGSSFACGKHHNAVSKFTKTAAAKEDRKLACCKSTTHSHDCNNHKHGKCGGACCQCIVSGLYKFLPLTVFEPQAFLLLPIAKKDQFSYSELFVNADAKGFRLPPKIS